MISRTLTDLATPVAAPAPSVAPSQWGTAGSVDPRAAALATAARLGIRMPTQGAAPVQAPSQMQTMAPPGAAGVSTAQPGYVSSGAGLNAPGSAPQPTQAPGSPNAQQMTPQKQAMLDALRARMGGLGMGGQMGANQAELSPAQKATLAVRNMAADRGVFAGQQTGAVMPPYRGPQ